jgi:hypothetical protein
MIVHIWNVEANMNYIYGKKDMCIETIDWYLLRNTKLLVSK